MISIYKGGVFTRKFIKNHHIAVTSLVKHPPFLPHPRTSRIYLTPPSPLARDVIYGWPLCKNVKVKYFPKELVKVNYIITGCKISYSMRRNNPANIYLFKFKNRNTRKRCEVSSKLTIKTPERRHNVVLVFLLLLWTYFRPFPSVPFLTFNKSMLAQKIISFSWSKSISDKYLYLMLFKKKHLKELQFNCQFSKNVVNISGLLFLL